jgi:hypothetical protein
MAYTPTVLEPQTRPRHYDVRLMARTIRDFIQGFRSLRSAGPCVTVFGSARFPETHPHYQVGRKVGRYLGRAGFTVLTGGGPGVMEAANRGAKEVGGRSVGCNIRLPIEQAPNQYLDQWIDCHHFFVRKVLLFKYSYGFVALPGGLGTMDELFEVLTLIQTGKIEHFPVVLIGMDYWRPLLGFLAQMVSAATIDASDLDLLLATDDVDAAVRHIEQHAAERFGLQARRPEAWRPLDRVRRAALRARHVRSAPGY